MAIHRDSSHGNNGPVLVTRGNRQYGVFVEDSSLHFWACMRERNSTTWTKYRLNAVPGNPLDSPKDAPVDGHLTPAIGIDAQNRVFICGNNHRQNVLRIVQTTSAAAAKADISAWENGAPYLPSIGGHTYAYTRFVQFPSDGACMLMHRRRKVLGIGGTDNPSWVAIYYRDPSTNTWVNRSFPLRGEDNTYNAPYTPSELYLDRNGRLHLFFAWDRIIAGANSDPTGSDRTADLTVDDFSYCYSDDRGVTWRNISGTIVAQPPTTWVSRSNAAGIACRTGISFGPTHPDGGTNNMYQAGVATDANDRPCAIYRERLGADGRGHARLVRWTGTAWTVDYTFPDYVGVHGPNIIRWRNDLWGLGRLEGDTQFSLRRVAPPHETIRFGPAVPDNHFAWPDPIVLLAEDAVEVMIVDNTDPVVYRIEAPAGVNAVIRASATSGTAPLTVVFNGSDSTGVAPLSFAWDLDNDGEFDDETQPVAIRTFTDPGVYTVRLRVTDANDDSDVESVNVIVIAPPGGSGAVCAYDDTYVDLYCEAGPAPIFLDTPLQSPWRLFVRDRNYARVSMVPTFTKFDAVLRLNDVDTWELTLPAESNAVQHLAAAGAGIELFYREHLILSGPVWTWRRLWRQDDDIVMFTGYSDDFHIAARVAHHCWDQIAPPYNARAYDVRSGPAEDVIKQYVAVNLGEFALESRRLPGLTIEGSFGRGREVTGRARMQPLDELLRELAVAGGDLVWQIRATPSTGPVFTVREPRDRTRLVRFTRELGNLRSYEYAVEGPESTVVYVAGGGEGVARLFVEVASLDTGDWPYRVEAFRDARDTDDTVELLQRGHEHLSETAPLVDARVEPFSGRPNLSFPIDWRLGDRVSVIVDGDRTDEIVRQVNIRITPDDDYVTLDQSGPGHGRRDLHSSPIAALRRRLLQRIHNLERRV